MIGSPSFQLVMAGVAARGLTLLVEVAFIVVVIVVVRRQRPDVAPLLLLALSMEMLFTLGSAAAQVILPTLLATNGNLTQYGQAQLISTVAITLGNAMSRVLLIWGVARLAAPASA